MTPLGPGLGGAGIGPFNPLCAAAGWGLPLQRDPVLAAGFPDSTADTQVWFWPGFPRAVKLTSSPSPPLPTPIPCLMAQDLSADHQRARAQPLTGHPRIQNVFCTAGRADGSPPCRPHAGRGIAPSSSSSSSSVLGIGGEPSGIQGPSGDRVGRGRGQLIRRSQSGG